MGKHKNEVHRNPFFTCEVRQTNLSTAKNLREHKNEFKGTCRKDGINNVCDKMFRMKSSSLKHKEEVHRNSSFTCEVCHQNLSTEHSLQRHKNKFNGTCRKDRFCDICDKMFKMKSS